MTEKEEKIAMIPSAIEDLAGAVSDDDLRLFSRYLAACQGAPATIQPGATKALAEALEDAIYTIQGNLDDDTHVEELRSALRLYHGDES